MHRSSSGDSSSQSSSDVDLPCSCCRCKQRTSKKPPAPAPAKGRFGLAYVLNSPNKTITTPAGWEIEFEDTPSGVIKDCDKLLEWVSYPPVLKSKGKLVEYPSACSKSLKSRGNQRTQRVETKNNKENKVCDHRYHWEPVDYHSCYWYSDKSCEHCWYTSQNSQNSRNSQNANNVRDEHLDYVPSKENQGKNTAQIIKVKDGQTQYSDNSIHNESSRKTMLLKDKEASTNSLELLSTNIVEKKKNNASRSKSVEERVTEVTEEAHVDAINAQNEDIATVPSNDLDVSNSRDESVTPLQRLKMARRSKIEQQLKS